MIVRLILNNTSYEIAMNMLLNMLLNIKCAIEMHMNMLLIPQIPFDEFV